MADDVRRWSVTYTKHLKQKRKVYQDGFLELQSSSHKVKLYNECEKLLESKIVKLDDAVKSGETLTFGAYLVDIGDPHGESKPVPNVVLQRDKTMADRNVRPNSKTSKGSLHFRKTSAINLSPSHKIIREFKKREVEKYSSPPSVQLQHTVEADSKEWEVLYTTQLTQKAKKFHDGILKIAISGSFGRKEATLLAEDGTILSHKYLKLSEDINNGSLFNMTNYLVDIGELRKHSQGPPEIRSSDVDNIKLCNRIPTNRPLSDRKPLQKATDSKFRKSNVTLITQNKPLRDASSILSILKKPGTQERVIKKEHVEEETRAVDVGGHPEVMMSSKATTTSNLNESASEAKDQSNIEISGDKMMSDSTLHDVTIDKRKESENTNLRNADFPSFDLGFD